MDLHHSVRLLPGGAAVRQRRALHALSPTRVAGAPPAPQQAQQAPAEQDDRQALEETFRLAGAASPELPPRPQSAISGASKAPAAAAKPAPAWLLRLNPPLWLVAAEQRLEADLPTIGLTVLFMVGLITYERGVQVRPVAPKQPTG